MQLPRFVALKSKYNDKFLRFVHEDGEAHGFLRFAGDEFVSPYAKFEVEPAKSGDGLVHLRCCYNGKYLVRWSVHHWWILAAADEPDEDQSKWTCTLFKPIYLNNGGSDDDAMAVRFLHIQLDHCVCLMRVGPPFDSCLYAGWKDPDRDSCDVCIITDMESLMILPKYVSFKGDNGDYLSARWIGGHQCLQFAGTEITDPTVGYEVFTDYKNGRIRIKSDYFGKFWRHSSSSSSWILADADDATVDPDTLFWPVKLLVDINNTSTRSSSVVCLRNLGNNKFCRRLTMAGKTSCLNAAVKAVSHYTRLQVYEAVVSREIYDVKFHLKDARIYNRRASSKMATQVATNRTQEYANHVPVKFLYTKTQSRSWNSSVFLKLDTVKTCRIKSLIPTIIDIGTEKINVEMSGEEFSGAYRWGEYTEVSTSDQLEYNVSIPPTTKVTVSLLATVGTFDVPFSYTQCDTLTNGKHNVYKMDDGVYTGINSYNFHYGTEQEMLY